MIGKSKKNLAAAIVYREEPVKPAVYIMLVLVIMVGVPLAWWNHKIGAEGFKIADTTPYQNVVAEVDSDLKAVQRLLANERVDENALKGTKTVTLITPDFIPTNDTAPDQDPKKFKINLSAIYWSAQSPIATINGENYRPGELIQGYRIVEIRKTSVVFEDPLGDTVVKNFYDYLETPKQ